jgi:hypothetical protein
MTISSDPLQLPAAAAFTIAEQSGQQRTVTLTGRGLPYRPFSLEASQRVEVTWLPGSPEGTGTVLGPSLDDTTINGFWKDLFIAPSPGQQANQTVPIDQDGTQVSSVADAIALMDSIRAQGQEVLVSWGPEQRLGYLVKFRKDWHNLHDCAWTMTFKWISDGTPTVASVLDDQTSTSDTNAQANAQSTAMQTSLVPPFPCPTAFISAIQDAASNAQNGVNNMVNAGTVQTAGAGASTIQASSTSLATTSNPNDVARRVAASASAVVAGTQQVIDVLDAQPARALAAAGSPNAGPIGQLPYGLIVQSEVYVRTAQIAARTLRRTSSIRRAVILRSLQSDLIGVYIARDGDDLRDVAFTFYQSRLMWRPLLQFNELGSTALSAGQVVLVPRITSGSA